LKVIYLKKLILLVLLLLSAAAAFAQEPPARISAEGFDVRGYIDTYYNGPDGGTILSDVPFDAVRISIYDLRKLETERSVNEILKQDAYSYDAASLLKKLSFNNLNPGEKSLIVEVRSGGEAVEIFRHDFYVGGSVKEAVHITNKCTITNSKGKKDDTLYSANFTYGWVNKSGSDYVIVTLPDSPTAECMVLYWNKAPEDYRIRIEDAAGNIIEESESNNPARIWNINIKLPENAKKVYITTSSTENMLCKIRVYEQGKVPECVQDWQALPEDVDLMLVVAHKNDETLYFSGTISKYIAEGKTVGVVVITEHGNRMGQEELFECLWMQGMVYQPIILNRWDGKSSYEEIARIWGGYDECTGEIVELIRHYTPEVVLSMDLEGEFGHVEHVMCADMTVSAVERSLDASWYPESAAEYGVWDVPKLYLHLYDKTHKLNIDFDTPLEMFDGCTAMEMAYAAFDRYQSQIQLHHTYSLDNDGIIYDKTCFGLYRSTVGEDVLNNDFFEHID